MSKRARTNKKADVSSKNDKIINISVDNNEYSVFYNLAYEIILHIFSYFDLLDMLQASRVCKLFKRVSSDSSLNCNVLLAWGKYSNNQNDKYSFPKIIPIHRKKIVKVIIGYYFGSSFYALTSHGEIYSWGDNYYGQLGLGNVIRQYIDTPQLITQLPKIVKMECHDVHCMAITDSQILYCWGSNLWRELGIENGESEYTVPMVHPYFINKKIKDVSVGFNFTIVQIENGDIYSFGATNENQLGRKVDGYSNGPNIIEYFKGKNIIKFRCGKDGCIAIDDKGALYEWGSSNDRDLQLNDDASPVQYSELENKKIVDISAGDHHRFAITDSNEVFCWGRNDSGQIGNHGGYIKVPTLFNYIRGKAKFIAASDKTFGIAENGNVFSWGNNRYAALLLNLRAEKVYKPTKVAVLSQKKIISLTVSTVVTVAIINPFQ